MVSKPKAAPKLVLRGSSKIGKNVYHTSLTAGASCPGETEFCGKTCYAKRFQRRYSNSGAAYARNLTLLETESHAYELKLLAEVAALPYGSLFRFHVAGDIYDEAHAETIGAVVDSRPDIMFWLYTRSWDVDMSMTGAVSWLSRKPNLKVWYSTDDDNVERLPRIPLLEARIFPDEQTARAEGYAVCPEQLERQPDCETCGLCFTIKKQDFRLAFIEH
jgi:hypothetical protein